MYKKILVADDEKSICEFFQILIKKISFDSEDTFEVTLAEDGRRALHLINQKSFDMIISDLKMPHASGLDLLKEAKKINPHSIFIMITAFDTTETAVKAMKMGAYDYIIKPFNVNEIKNLILSSLKLQDTKEDVEFPDEKGEQGISKIPLIGESSAMRKIHKTIEQLSHSTSNVLITGESGTGKEVIARAIHNSSQLKDSIFIPVNCGAIPDELLESEMFGHKKGSFTGAIEDKKGFFESADGGSLFLDEIGDMPLPVQPKLLRALQEKVIRKVGAVQDKKIKVRLIAATNRELEHMIKEGSFREDLYYRLNVVNIHISPLRERKEDIPLLIRYFLKKHQQKLHRSMEINLSDEIMQLFQEYNYMGNVRELENLVERLLVLSEGDIITKEEVVPLFKNQILSLSTETVPIPQISLSEEGFNMEEVVGDIEKDLLLQAIKKANGVKTEAASLLGLSLRAFRYRLRKYQLDFVDGDTDYE